MRKNECLIQCRQDLSRLQCYTEMSPVTQAMIGENSKESGAIQSLQGKNLVSLEKNENYDHKTMDKRSDYMTMQEYMDEHGHDLPEDLVFDDDGEDSNDEE